MVRTKGEAGTGNIVEAVRHMRAIMGGIRHLQTVPEEELMTEAKVGTFSNWYARLHVRENCPW